VHELVDIQITTDEPKSSYFISRLIEAGISPKLEKLPTGDFLIFGRTQDDSVLIERKTASDFLGSVEGKKIAPGQWENGRIWDQLKRMKETGIKDRWVLIEGSPYNRRLTSFRKKGFTKNRIWGALRAIRKWDCRVEYTKNIDETIEYLIYLVKQKKKPKKVFALRSSPPNSMSPSQKRLYILQGFPGVGPKTSRKIMREHKTLLHFFNNISKSKSVGKKIKKDIKKTLN